jgi:hypothetical protein
VPPDERAPTPEELTKLAPHLVYERQMLYRSLSWCFDERMTAIHPESHEQLVDSVRRSNAYFEAAVIHARNLVYFFTATPSGDDVAACHYLRDWAPDRATVDELQAAMRPLNKRAFHVTAYRVRVPKGTEDRDLSEVWLLLDRLWNSFYEQLTADQRGWFAGAVV